MSQPIDRAYVEIEARGEEDAARDIKKMLDQLQRDLKKLSDQVEATFEETARDIEREMTEAGSILTKEAVRQRKEWKKTGTELSLAMKEAANSAENSIDNFTDEAVRDMDRITRAAIRAATAVSATDGGPSAGGGGGGPDIGDGGDGGGVDIDIDRDVKGIRGMLGGLGGVMKSITSAVGELVDALSKRLGSAAQQAVQSVGALVGALGTALGPIGSLIASLGMLGVALALIPFIVPVISALSQLWALLLLLPAAIGFLIAAIAPLIIAFQGVGDAVSALASGDLEQIDKAMQNLAPNARKFAVELFGLRDEMKQLKFAVQDAFFEKFNGSLNELVTRLLPTLKSGLADVSGSLGELGADLTDMLSSSRSIDALNELFATTGRIIDDLRGPLIEVLDSLMLAMKESLPFLERVFKSLGDGMQKFANWLNKAVEDGRFQKWLEDAFDMAKQLWDLLKALGELVGAVFGGTEEQGESIIESITASIRELAGWLKTAEGKKAIQDMADSAKEFAKGMVSAVEVITKLQGLVSDFKDFKDSPFGLLLPSNIMGRFEAFKKLWDELWPKIKEFAASAGEWFEGIGANISEFFGGIGQWFEDTWNATTEKGGEILQWFEDLPGKIGEWVSQIPDKLKDAFTTAFDNATYAIGYGFGTIMRFFVDLPSNVETALKDFWTTVTKWFEDTRKDVVDTVTDMWNSISDWFDKLPGRVDSAAHRVWKNVTDWFEKTRTSAINRARDTINSVTDWFDKLPGRATNAISSLPNKIWNILREIVTDAGNIGRDIMNGIGNGIENGWNYAIEAAKRAARNILSGFWDAFEIGSPSKLTAREVGVPVMQGVGVGIKRGVPDVRDTINSAVNSVVSATRVRQPGGEAEGAATAVMSTAGGGGIVIQNLTIPIQGVWDMTDPTTTRRIAYNIHEALENLKRDYR